jgi:metal-responsive CopG/Arc/MetJ family transcriptional regulator
MRIPISVSIDEKLVGEIDKKKGLVSRSRWIESLLKEAMRK